MSKKTKRWPRMLVVPTTGRPVISGGDYDHGQVYEMWAVSGPEDDGPRLLLRDLSAVFDHVEAGDTWRRARVMVGEA